MFSFWRKVQVASTYLSKNVEKLWITSNMSIVLMDLNAANH